MFRGLEVPSPQTLSSLPRSPSAWEAPPSLSGGKGLPSHPMLEKVDGGSSSPASGLLSALKDARPCCCCLLCTRLLPLALIKSPGTVRGLLRCLSHKPQSCGYGRETSQMGIRSPQTPAPGCRKRRCFLESKMNQSPDLPISDPGSRVFYVIFRQIMGN